MAQTNDHIMLQKVSGNIGKQVVLKKKIIVTVFDRVENRNIQEIPPSLLPKKQLHNDPTATFHKKLDTPYLNEHRRHSLFSVLLHPSFRGTFTEPCPHFQQHTAPVYVPHPIRNLL